MLKTIRQKLKSIFIIKAIVVSLRKLKVNYSKFKIFGLLKWFFKDFVQFKKMELNKKFNLSLNYLKPSLYDKTDDTPIDPIYFYQDAWCAKKIFQNKPRHHYDIGSKVDMLGIISQFVPVTFIDIRPIDLNLPGLTFQKADILNLPFSDNSIYSLSSICVLEHIGLGRYGDRLDHFGSEKAIKEIKRILAYNGNLYISLPVDRENRIYFNSHRAFTREYILELFNDFKLIEEKYIYGKKMENIYNKNKGFGTGLFHFVK